MTKQSQTPSKRRGIGPVLLSAFACPGIGQLVQRRWIAGLLWLCLFLGGFVRFLCVAGRAIFSYYTFAFNIETADPPVIPVRGILMALAFPLAVYVANVVDAAIAARPSSRPEPPPLPKDS